MNELMKMLKELRPDVDFTKEKHLIDDGILDSFDLVSLMGEVGETFHVEISFADIEPENFNSVEGMFRLIQKLQQRG